MGRGQITIVVLLLVVVTTAFITACEPTKPNFKNYTLDGKETNQIVSASIFPVYDIARQIGGSKVGVHLILKPGESPHMFTPTINQKKQVEASSRVFVIGYSLDNWVFELSEDRSKFVVLDRYIDLLPAQSTADTIGADSPRDPHYWLHPDNGIKIASLITEELISIDSENSDYYKLRLDRFISNIEPLKAELATKAKAIEGKPFLTLHNSWQYFALAFNLEIVGSFIPDQPGVVRPRHIQQLQQTIQRDSVTAIFLEPQLSTGTLRAFAKDNDLSVGILDPIGGSDTIGSYQELLEYNLHTLIEYLSN